MEKVHVHEWETPPPSKKYSCPGFRQEYWVAVWRCKKEGQSGFVGAGEGRREVRKGIMCGLQQQHFAMQRDEHVGERWSGWRGRGEEAGIVSRKLAGAKGKKSKPVPCSSLGEKFAELLLSVQARLPNTAWSPMQCMFSANDPDHPWGEERRFSPPSQPVFCIKSIIFRVRKVASSP